MKREVKESVGKRTLLVKIMEFLNPFFFLFFLSLLGKLRMYLTLTAWVFAVYGLPRIVFFFTQRSVLVRKLLINRRNLITKLGFVTWVIPYIGLINAGLIFWFFIDEEGLKDLEQKGVRGVYLGLRLATYLSLTNIVISTAFF